jgi:hypothetical protein
MYPASIFFKFVIARTAGEREAFSERLKRFERFKLFKIGGGDHPFGWQA